MLWRLISHDIWFLWERAEYLQVEDMDVLTQVAFKVNLGIFISLKIKTGYVLKKI